MDIKKTYQGTEVQDVLALLEKYQGKSKIIAGGTDLIIQLHGSRAHPEVLIDISSLDEIKEVKLVDENVQIGGATTFTRLIKSPKIHKKLEGLIEAASLVGSPQIRNAATLGGNICNGSPAADIVPPLLALDAELVIKREKGERRVSLETFFIDKGVVDLKENELLAYIQFKNLRENQGLGFTKLGLRKALAISRITVAVFIEIEGGSYKEVRIATGSCGKFGLREKAVEDFMRGKAVEEKTIKEATELYKQQISKRLAGRSGSDFKRDAVQGIFKDALKKATNLAKPAAHLSLTEKER